MTDGEAIENYITSKRQQANKLLSMNANAYMKHGNFKKYRTRMDKVADAKLNAVGKFIDEYPLRTNSKKSLD